MTRTDTDQRLTSLTTWLNETLHTSQLTIHPASEDASFRRYFRVRDTDQSFIAMDAPPGKEDCTPYVEVAKRIRAQALNAPAIHALDLQQGFLLLDDMGDQLYLDGLKQNTVDALYQDALNALLTMQGKIKADDLPPYDQALLQQEMNLFTDWFLKQHLQIQLTADDLKIIQDCHAQLITSALQQPKVFVHRDYHSRNLMIVADNNPGILDFQDAMFGPITYDLVSLLRDCYIEWPDERVYSWCDDYYQQLTAQQLVAADQETFNKWFDWMGVQRHLKAIGIFARLNIRDGKPGYLKDIPRTFNYVKKVCNRYAELQAFFGLLCRLNVEEQLAK